MSISKFFTGVFGVLLLYVPVLAQHSNPHTQRLKRVRHSMEVVQAGGKTFTLDQIEGSPYLTAEFHKSKIIMKEQEDIPEIQLRYNAFRDRFEFLKKNTSYQITNEEAIRQISHLNKDFIHMAYKPRGGKVKEGFLVRLVEGPCSIYKRYRVEFLEPEPPKTSFHDPKPPRFEEEDPEYYIQLDDQKHPREIQSFRRGKFLNRFGSLEDPLKDYIKEKDINLRDQGDLIRFTNHYNKKYGKKE